MLDTRGYFGPFGGRFVPETLMAALEELDAAYTAAASDPSFLAAWDEALRTYVNDCVAAKMRVYDEDMSNPLTAHIPKSC